MVDDEIELFMIDVIIIGGGVYLFILLFVENVVGVEV